MLKERALVLTPDVLDSMITDYHWMVNAIKEMRAEMVIGAKTAQYGIEASLPKAAGGIGDPIMQEAIRRSKNNKRVADYEKKIMAVQKLLEKVTGEREVQVLNWMLDGKSKRWIAKKMEVSHTQIQNIKENILIKMLA
ncbi:LuxR C-terminal-related transcriptional regulator [Lysinibacillus sp. CD3-6]|uniref:LuxR C-terminal-related transcriptional regulator n=1 Tax=Lysinibacillus sp. CD3-6 TaxID=2892541 RepID=UPI001C251E7A|nr:LuxR C-terminal-related transcriptional regulator [Lysinibacillus sp. CD3-6]UED79205.1 LuxR C-terminal-related transcriptional regulator [Lysinibacillus sp. CD3-6]